MVWTVGILVLALASGLQSALVPIQTLPFFLEPEIVPHPMPTFEVANPCNVCFEYMSSLIEQLTDVPEVVRPLPENIAPEIPPVVRPLPENIAPEIPPVVRPLPENIAPEIPTVVRPVPENITPEIPTVVRPVPEAIAPGPQVLPHPMPTVEVVGNVPAAFWRV